MARFKIETHDDNGERVGNLLATGQISAAVWCKQHEDWLVIAEVDTLAAVAQLLYELANPAANRATPAEAIVWLERQRDIDKAVTEAREPRVKLAMVVDPLDGLIHSHPYQRDIGGPLRRGCDALMKDDGGRAVRCTAGPHLHALPKRTDCPYVIDGRRPCILPVNHAGQCQP